MRGDTRGPRRVDETQLRGRVMSGQDTHGQIEFPPIEREKSTIFNWQICPSRSLRSTFDLNICVFWRISVCLIHVKSKYSRDGFQRELLGDANRLNRIKRGLSRVQLNV